MAEWRNGANGYLPTSFMVHANDDNDDNNDDNTNDNDTDTLIIYII